MPVNAPGSSTHTAANGTTIITSHSGWVHTWKRLMADTPCVTSGITTTAQIR